MSHRACRMAIREAAEGLVEPHLEFESSFDAAEPIEVYREASPKEVALRWLAARRGELGNRVLRAWLVDRPCHT